jgi:hypothetical protein
VTHASGAEAAVPLQGAARPWRRALPYLPALIGSSLVGALAVRAILAQAGRPAAPLDDSFIHLQYARRLAEGGFFSFVAGEGYTTGATSLLWPVLLAPFHLLGARGLSLLWVAWALALLAHAGLAVETARIAERLAGRWAGLVAGACCVCCGAFAWFAWSGMETVPFAFVLMRAARLSAERFEPRPGDAGAATRARAIELALLGAAAPLLRPEGAVLALLAAGALVARPAVDGARLPGRWSLPLVPVVGAALQPMLNLLLAGHASSSTTAVKWLPANPYYDAGRLLSATLANVRLLFGDVLDGGDWTSVFLPEGFVVPLLLGAAALPLAARRARAPWHAGVVALLALCTLLPCTYLSFLWNRVRYVWPFAGAWFVLVACFAREAGELARRSRLRLAHLGPVLGGCVVGALLTRMPVALRDLATSARAIDRQQVTLAEWLRAHLPGGARVGVNDTGAIAYLGGHPTFDVVGLTTEGEARYWVGGPGARYEHYERLSPERRPTHFAVYPHWMACPPVLGRELTQATVTEQSILGGPTMVVHEARWDLLGTGDLPEVAPPGTLVDELDVADLDAEATHRYQLLDAWDHESVVLALRNGEGTVADGARSNRRQERFVLRGSAGVAARLVIRAASDLASSAEVRVGGVFAGRVVVGAEGWSEQIVELPAGPTERALEIDVPGQDPPITVAHYWLYE